MEPFRNIGIIGRLGSTQVLDTIRRLKKFLIDRHLHVILEDTIAEVLPGHGLQTCSRKIMGEICDLVVVVGGDGSMLGAARALARHKVPVLGINRGSLGFLTDIRPDELEAKVGEVLDGQYIVESRFLLDAQVRRGIDSMGQGDALNDVVLHPGKSTRMIEFEPVYRRPVRLQPEGRRPDRRHAHRFHRLRAVRRRSDHASEAGCHRHRADVPAHAFQPPDRGGRQQRA